jgi:hypothetical protein
LFGNVMIDFYPQTLQQEQLCYRWVSAFVPRIVSSDVIRHRQETFEWKWWHFLPFVFLNAYMKALINVNIWYEHRVCARVGGYYDTNCGERLLTEIRCKSSWLLFRSSGGEIEPPPQAVSEGFPDPGEDEEGPIEDAYPTSPDDEPSDKWERHTVFAWDWPNHSCRPLTYSSLSWKWVPNIKRICLEDPDLKFDRAIRRSPEQKVIAYGNCTGPSGDYIYMYEVTYYSRVK